MNVIRANMVQMANGKLSINALLMGVIVHFTPLLFEHKRGKNDGF